MNSKMKDIYIYILKILIKELFDKSPLKLFVNSIKDENVSTNICNQIGCF